MHNPGRAAIPAIRSLFIAASNTSNVSVTLSSQGQQPDVSVMVHTRNVLSVTETQAPLTAHVPSVQVHMPSKQVEFLEAWQRPHTAQVPAAPPGYFEQVDGAFGDT